MNEQFQKPKFGQQTPPAIFPPLLGLIGLALALDQAVPVFGLPFALVETVKGAFAMLLGFALVAYFTKVFRRFSVIADEVKSLPGRAGTAAMMMAAYCLATVLIPYSTPLATAILFAALGWHLLVAALSARHVLSLPKEQRGITPVWHLTLVGPIVVVLAAFQMGYHALSYVIFALTLTAGAVIWPVCFMDVVKNGSPPPLRPTAAIHLAPASLMTLVTGIFGWTQISVGFGFFAMAIFFVLVARVRWLTAAGFSPFWGSFTFPLAAFSSAMLSLSGQGAFYGVLGAVTLAAACAIIPWIVFRVLKMWATGQLALKTNAARA